MLKKTLFSVAFSVRPRCCYYSMSWGSAPYLQHTSGRSTEGLCSRNSLQLSFSRKYTETGVISPAAEENQPKSRPNKKVKKAKKAKKSKSKSWALPSLEDMTLDMTTTRPAATLIEAGITEVSEHESTNTPNESFQSTRNPKVTTIAEKRPDLAEPLSLDLERDEKAQKILERWPDLRARMGALVYEDSEEGNRVPLGWRKNKFLPEWKRQIYGLREKFGDEKWQPRKKLSREAMDGIRVLKEHSPEMNAGEFAKMFQVSPESIRRILKSSWSPQEYEMEGIAKRWVRRGDRVKDEIRLEARKEREAKMEEIQARRAEQEIVRNARGISVRKVRKKAIDSMAASAVRRKSDQDDDDDYPPTGVQDMIF